MLGIVLTAVLVGGLFAAGCLIYVAWKERSE